jgi:hypothetical protein
MTQQQKIKEPLIFRVYFTVMFLKVFSFRQIDIEILPSDMMYGICF